MKNFFLVVISFVTLLVFLNPTIACDIEGTTGFVEKNDLWIPDIPRAIGSNVTEESFNRVLDKIDEIYTPEFASYGKQLVIERKWRDGTVNAYAKQRGNQWFISMFGGLARHEEVTLDAFATVACHEIGHHIGGDPIGTRGGRKSWFSNEGQSDYFSTAKCLRKVIEDDDNIRIMSQVYVPPVVQRKCEDNFMTPETVAMCVRSSMASRSLGRFMWALRGRRGNPPDFHTPNPKVVTSTYDRHPESQCRLDTYFSGSLCGKSHYTDMSRDDSNVHACTRFEKYTDGLRPLCWFRPPVEH